MTPAELEQMSEDSKNDRHIIVGSDVRQLVGEVRRAWAERDRLREALERIAEAGYGGANALTARAALEATPPADEYHPGRHVLGSMRSPPAAPETFAQLAAQTFNSIKSTPTPPADTSKRIAEAMERSAPLVKDALRLGRSIAGTDDTVPRLSVAELLEPIDAPPWKPPADTVQVPRKLLTECLQHIIDDTAGLSDAYRQPQRARLLRELRALLGAGR